MKFLPTNMNKGTMESMTTTQAATMTPRCAMLQVSMRVYQISRCLKTNESLEECWAWPGVAAPGSGRLMKREQSIGVRVNETSRETAMAKAEVKPKELMKRPTIPPMKPTGRKTASRLMVVAMTARPISLVPRIAASNGGMFFSSMRSEEHTSELQ